MTGRTCGECSLCCCIMGIEELNKPPRQWCQHCNVGADHACTIYDDRPQSCRNFRCLWLENATTPEAMYPKKTGVVVWVLQGGKHAVALTRENDPTAWRKPAVMWTLRRLAAQGLAVIAFSGKRAWAVGKVGDEEIDGAAIKQDGLGLAAITIDGAVMRRINEKRVA